MQSNLVQTIFKTGLIFKRSRKTPQYNKYSKQFQIFNQKSLQKRICSRILQEKGSNNLLNIIFTEKLRKATYTERKKAECFLIISKIVFFFLVSKFYEKIFCFLFFYYPNCLKIISPIHVCLRINYHLFLIITHWRYFKYNDLLHTLNVYKILEKEHQEIVRAADKISVSKELFSKYLEYVPPILWNYKKLKSKKIGKFKISSNLSAQKILVTTLE